MATIMKPYKLLRYKMSPKARAAATKKTEELLAALTLQEVRYFGRFSGLAWRA